jgi:hypothetical protein
MSARLRTALVSAGVAAVTVTAVVGAATPAFAKSDTQLSGPRVAHVRHAFDLTVWVGDDGGAKPARARQEVRGAHGRYHSFGPWRQLRLIDPDDESYAFRVTEGRRGAVTFRAVVSRGYATTNAVTVSVR